MNRNPVRPELARVLRAAVPPCAVLLLNLYLCRGLFRLEYSQFMGSIEAAFISISRYMLLHWRELGWMPQWYGGIPFQNSYPPLLHATGALVAAAMGWSAARAYHFAAGTFYCLGAVSLYALTARFSRSRVAGFTAAAVYSVVSWAAVLIAPVRADLGGIVRPRRLQVLMAYGEGPHITGLFFLPLAVLALDRALRKRQPAWYLAASILMALTALSNWLGTFALAMAVVAYFLAFQTGSRQQAWSAAVRCLAMAVLAYALAAPWLPPSTIAVIRHNSALVGGDFRQTHRWLPVTAVALAAITVGMARLCARARIRASLRFFLLFSLLTGILDLGAEWLRVKLVPQPERYHIEMEMGLCALCGMGAATAWRRAPRRARMALALCAGVALTAGAKSARNYALQQIQPVDITTTDEYRTAKWLQSHAPGARTYLTGNPSYWLNAFSDAPQVGGGFDQGIVNYEIPVAQFQIGTGSGAGSQAGEYALLWLKAFGAQTIGVGTAVYWHPEVFRALASAGRMHELWRGSDVVLYGTGARGSLAHVVPDADVVRHPPVNGIDVGELSRYVQALDRGPAPDLVWRDPNRAEVVAELRPEEALSLQITAHPGWRASMNGAAARLERDGLGFAFVKGPCPNPCRIELRYDGGLEMKAARGLRAAGMLIFAAYAIAVRRRRRGSAYNKAR